MFRFSEAQNTIGEMSDMDQSEWEIPLKAESIKDEEKPLCLLEGETLGSISYISRPFHSHCMHVTHKKHKWKNGII